jgi:lipid II:glycine glycyltransferase (peptidoglycan interpeptide bridge formation enzyme)
MQLNLQTNLQSNLQNPIYFNQTTEWAEFWLKSQAAGHDLMHIEDDNFSCYLYEYPFIMGKKMWYIPRGFVLKNKEFEKVLALPKNVDLYDRVMNDVLSNIKQFLERVRLQAEERKDIVLIKFEINDYLLRGLKFEEQKGEMNPTKEIQKLLNTDTNLSVKISDKKLQYLQTRLISLDGLFRPESALGPVVGDDINAFWDLNQKWFTANMDKRTRYGTRKSLDAGWKISSGKSKENFEAFYNLHVETGQRQSFGVHNKEYLQSLYRMPFSKVVILRDQDEVPQAAWFGVILNGHIINLFGGNSTVSRDNYGQYLLNLAAIYLGYTNECKVLDLGGLEEGKGFNLFKLGYLGINQDFYGAYDIVLKPTYYTLYNTGRMLKGK